VRDWGLQRVAHRAQRGDQVLQDGLQPGHQRLARLLLQHRQRAARRRLHRLAAVQHALEQAVQQLRLQRLQRSSLHVTREEPLAVAAQRPARDAAHERPRVRQHRQQRLHNLRRHAHQAGAAAFRHGAQRQDGGLAQPPLWLRQPRLSIRV
jgi:hypothetical protein